MSQELDVAQLGVPGSGSLLKLQSRYLKACLGKDPHLSSQMWLSAELVDCFLADGWPEATLKFLRHPSTQGCVGLKRVKM